MKAGIRIAGLIAVLALPGQLAAQEAAGVRPHSIVSNTGDFVFVERGGTQGSDSFEGTAPEGMADDSAAEFGNVEETAQEIWDLVLREPKSAPVGREVVIGADNRTRINPTTGFPNRAIGLITLTQRGSSGTCTGWLINKNTVITAGHCVHEGDTGSPSGWSTNVRFYPGRNGSSSPYGFCTATKLFSVTGWTNGGDEQYDYGALKLNCSVGNTTGWLGYWWQSASLTGTEATVRGYPGDKPSGTQWTHTRTVASTTTRQTFYQTDTAPGQSGSPVLDLNRGGPFCSGQCSHSVHAYGTHNGPPHATNNHATRIVEAVANNFAAWKAVAP